ncbi:MAG: hypothetical protein HC929_15390 [Leptolyngbyaceae cyanobacterium SM2_5_2]|nr:hypothetical protein [Leptolyngbyaceae cyanobacterium SM2_5_2]
MASPSRWLGVYTLRLTVGDDAQAISDEMTLTVNHAPIITLAESMVVQLPDRARLTAQVDSGLGSPQQGRLTLRWSQLSGPGTVSFNEATLANPTAQFSTSGTYVLRLTANNGQLTTVADITVHANTAPTLRVAAPPLVNLPTPANLQGEIVETGLADPAGTVTSQWTLVNGPGPVTFADAQAWLPPPPLAPVAITACASRSAPGRSPPVARSRSPLTRLRWWMLGLTRASTYRPWRNWMAPSAMTASQPSPVA